MYETTYLTVDKLKDYTPISANVDVVQLESWIPVAETMHLDFLGLALDTQLKSEIEAGSLSGNNETLVNKIAIVSAWFTFFEAVGFIRTKTMNKGVIQQFSDNSNVASSDDFKSYKQDILDKAMFFRNGLIDYLNKNKALFPLYRSNIDDCDNSNDKDFASGIYV